MSSNATQSAENNTTAALYIRIKTLESDLRMAKDFEGSLIEAVKLLQEKNIFLDEENERLRTQNHELQNPDGRDNARLSWLATIVTLLRRFDRPMQKMEIEEELRQIRKRPPRHNYADPDSLVSVVLYKGVKAGRLKKIKIPGTRGGFYALEEWVDGDGNLTPELRQKID